MAAEHEADDGSFIKTLFLGAALVALTVGILSVVIHATRADEARQAGVERYVRAHQCVVAYEEHSYAQLYRCDAAAENHYLKPADLRDAAQAELTLAKLR
jgi:hypothetical protein